MTDHSQAPLNPIHPVVWLLVLPMVAIEIVLSLADYGLIGGAYGVGWRLDGLQRYSFSPEIMTAMIDSGQYPSQHMLRFLSYSFVFPAATSALFAIVIILALGKMVAEVFNPIAVIILFFVSPVFAALAFTFALPGTKELLIGGFPAAYGLIGAYTFVLWRGLVAQGAQQMRAFRLIGFLLFVQIFFAVSFETGWAWLADAFGFVGGFLLSFILRPDGLTWMLAKLRQR